MNAGRVGRIPVVFEDDSVIVVDKPAGLLTMATATERERTLYALLRARAHKRRPPEKLFIVHRLDRDASGLLVFAKTFEAKERLQSQFKDHSAGRHYLAMVSGVIREDQFTIRSHLAENRALRVYSSDSRHDAKRAVTHVQVVKRLPKATVIRVRLETGRKHQIRVHLAERGHPILGDKVYGRADTGMRRLALHGTRLEFVHPGSGKRMVFESPAPPAFGGVR